MLNDVLEDGVPGAGMEALRGRLARWRPEAAPGRTLVDRLQQAHGWPRGHGLRLIEEYRRFLFLAVTRRGQVCPSDAVDQVWHEHLLDSRDYFGPFCREVLQFTLHHCPSRGGAAEQARHAANYAATLQAYEATFGQAPPADLWPALARRFAERFRRVSLARQWLLPRPAPGLAKWPWLALALLVTGCASSLAVNPGTSGPDFLRHYGRAWGVLALAALWLAWRGRAAGVSGADLAAPALPVEAGYLAGGGLRAILAALARLVQRGHLQPGAADQPWTVLQAPGPRLHPLERAAFEQLSAGKRPAELPPLLQPELDALHGQLHARGWLLSPERERRGLATADRLLYGSAALLLAWGVLRIGHGLARGYPTGFLIALTVVALMVTLLVWRVHPGRASREGRVALKEARQALSRRRQLGLSDPLLPMAMALLGLGVLSTEAQASLGTALAPMQPRDAGGSGCGGSSCGGSDGGGDGGSSSGCGGCGGD